MYRLLLLTLLLLLFVVSYSTVIYVNTTNCSYYFPNITNNTIYILENGTYNATECINLSLVNKYNVTIIGKSRSGVDLYNLSAGYTLLLKNSNVTFNNLSITVSTKYIYTDKSNVNLNNVNIFLNKSVIGYSIFYLNEYNNLTLNHTYIYLSYNYQVVFDQYSFDNVIKLYNSIVKSVDYARLFAEVVGYRENKAYLYNDTIEPSTGCFISVSNLFMNDTRIYANTTNSNIVILTKNISVLNNDFIRYYNTLYFQSNKTYINNTTIVVVSTTFGFDVIGSNILYMNNDRYFNNKTTLNINANILYLYNNTFFFNTSLNYIINTLDRQYYVFTPPIMANYTYAKNNTVNNNLSIETCASNKKLYELILDNCSSTNTSSFFVLENQNSTYSYLNNSVVILPIYNATNITLVNDNINFFYSKSGNLTIKDSKFRTIDTYYVKIINSRTKYGNVSFYIPKFVTYPVIRPTFVDLNTTEPIKCSKLYAYGYINTLFNNSFEILENNTISKVYDSKLCGGVSSFKILYGDKVYAYSSYLNNYTVDSSLIILNNTSTIWIPTLPDSDYYCNGTPMFTIVVNKTVKHVKKHHKKCVVYVKKKIKIEKKENSKSIPAFLLIIAGIIIILRSILL